MNTLAGIVRTILIALIASALTVFVIQNLAPIEVQFIVWSVHMPRAFALIAGVALGFVLAVLIRAIKPITRRGVEVRS